MPLPRRRVAPLAEAKQFCASGVDPDGFVRKFVNDKIGKLSTCMYVARKYIIGRLCC